MTSNRLLWFAFALALVAAPSAQPVSPAVVLVTLDGARTDEVFGGLDVAVVRAQVEDGQRLQHHPLYKRLWAPTPEERRAKLMPFFWTTLMREQGVGAGHGPARVSLAMQA